MPHITLNVGAVIDGIYHHSHTVVEVDEATAASLTPPYSGAAHDSTADERRQAKEAEERAAAERQAEADRAEPDRAEAAQTSARTSKRASAESKDKEG